MSDIFVGDTDRSSARSKARFIITVDQAAIQHDEPAIHVHNLDTDERANATEVDLEGVRVVQGPERQDGARVWIEAVRADVVR